LTRISSSKTGIKTVKDEILRVHRFEPASQVNGPGLRAVLWVQGCGLACPGCFNPETHPFDGGQRWTIEEAAGHILAAHQAASGGLEGLTLSGGEPAVQHRVLAKVLKEVRRQSSLSVVVFTGYTLDELHQMPAIKQFLSQVDLLIAGRYDASQRVAHGLVGSSNKVLHFLTSRYSLPDMAQIPEAEIIISPDGEIILSGIDPLQW
jgi:anaerobic ribonucleoside-triphosphate reductase activating protein